MNCYFLFNVFRMLYNSMLEAAKLHSNFFSARLINSICLKIPEQDDTERFDERSDEKF